MLENPQILVSDRELRRALECHTLSSTTPRDRDLLQQVVGPGGTEQGYLYGGFTAATGIRAALRAVGRDIYQFTNILDFGCGSARVLRWFQDIRPTGRLYGCDINPEAVQWCVDNIAFAEFTNNTPLPALPYADQTFDLIYGISVFTHLDEQYQRTWLSELRRIIKPGGVLMMTVHGSDYAARSLLPEEYDSFEKSGFLYKEATDRTSTKGLPDFYQVAFHTREYVERVWSEFFDVDAYLSHGCMYLQDLVVMQPKSVSPGQRFREDHKILTANLPIAHLDEPVAGVWLLEEQIRVKGWAFYLGGGDLDVDLRIDGDIVHRCPCNLERPSVARYFSTSNGQRSGFEALIPAKGLAKGWHALWISVGDNPFPLCSSYFFYPSFDSEQDVRALVDRLACHQHEVREVREKLADFERTERIAVEYEGQIRDLRASLAFLQREAAVYSDQARELRETILAREEGIAWMETQVADGKRALEWRIHESHELGQAKNALETALQQTGAALHTAYGQLALATKQLDGIHASNGWKCLTKVRHLRDRLFPLESVRGRLLRKVSRHAWHLR